MHHRRKKPRARTYHNRWSCGTRTGEAPKHWNVLNNNRPKRRNDKRNCHKVVMGNVDPDGVVWELGNRKPHEYYW